MVCPQICCISIPPPLSVRTSYMEAPLIKYRLFFLPFPPVAPEHDHLIGSNSPFSCLITAVMTDLWVHTVEPIATPKPPPHLMGLYEAAASVSLSSDSTPVDYRNPMAIDFDIGLWKVCPSVKEWIHSEYASKFDTNSTLWLEPPSP